VRNRIIGFFLASAFLLAAAPASAQTMKSTDDKPVVGVGLSFLSDEETATGFFVDFAKTFRVASEGKVAIGGVGDFSLHHFGEGDTNFIGILGGARATFGASDQVDVFGQFLIGFQSAFEDTNLAWQPGFGVDVKINERFTFRGQLDFRAVRFSFEDVSDTDWVNRFSFGISMPIGGQ
jgi:hypothetical protein